MKRIEISFCEIDARIRGVTAPLVERSINNIVDEWVKQKKKDIARDIDYLFSCIVYKIVREGPGHDNTKIIFEYPDELDALKTPTPDETAEKLAHHFTT